MTVAVVGAGISGAACARALVEAGQDVRILDRGRVAGGRMASRVIAERRVDTGASYLTARDPRFTAVVDDWLRRGVARAWTDTFHVGSPAGLESRKSGPIRYAAPRGLRSLVEDLLGDSTVAAESDVLRIGPGPTVDGTAYDAVVLAMPDPQAALLLDERLHEECLALTGREWEPVLALAAGWDQRTWDDALDGCFVHDSPVIEWIADDGRRRGDDAPVLVAHSASPFAATRLDDPAEATEDMLAAVREVLDIAAPPTWTRVQRWTFARPVRSRDVPFHLGAAQVGLCGDGWGASKIETAWLSGHLLGAELAARL